MLAAIVHHAQISVKKVMIFSIYSLPPIRNNEVPVRSGYIHLHFLISNMSDHGGRLEITRLERGLTLKSGVSLDGGSPCRS